MRGLWSLLGEVYLQKIWPRSRSPLQADRPWPSAQTRLGEDATHCPDLIAGSIPVLEHVLPIGVFATKTQSSSPELIELKFFPQFAKDPNREPFVGQCDRLGNADFLQLTNSNASYRLSTESYCAKT
jgi:hypothetical protein